MDKKKFKILKGAKIPSGGFSPITQPVIQAAQVNLGLASQGAATIVNESTPPSANYYIDEQMDGDDTDRWPTNALFSSKAEWQVIPSQVTNGSNRQDYVESDWKMASGPSRMLCGCTPDGSGSYSGSVDLARADQGDFSMPNFSPYSTSTGTDYDGEWDGDVDDYFDAIRGWMYFYYSDSNASDQFSMTFARTPHGAATTKYIGIRCDKNYGSAPRLFYDSGSGLTTVAAVTETGGTGFKSIRWEIDLDTGLLKMRHGPDIYGFTWPINTPGTDSRCSVYDFSAFASDLELVPLHLDVDSAVAGSDPLQLYWIQIELRLKDGSWSNLT